jgi:hypothetical protein
MSVHGLALVPAALAFLIVIVKEFASDVTLNHLAISSSSVTVTL